MFTIYNASAGSGKTFTLAVQYITRLLASSIEGGNAYRQVLAVTFTNKATAEMKDRILQQLYGIGAGLSSSDKYLEAVQKSLHKMRVDMDVKEIRERAHRVLGEILHDYSRFRVETIDSFFRSVLTDMARELGLPAGLRADINQRSAISEAVNRIIEQLDEHDDIRRWITEFVRDQMSEGDRWDVTRIIKEFADHLFDQPYLENQDALNSFLTDNDAVKTLRDKLDDARQHIYAGIEEAIANLEAAAPDHSVDADGTTSGDYSRFNKRGYIESHVARLRKTIEGGPMPEISASLRKWSEDGLSMLNKKHDPADEPLAIEVGKRLCEMFMLEDYAVGIINSINLTRQNINPMRLLGTVGRKVNEVTQDRGAFLLANTPLLLRRMVKDDDTSFIYERTGTMLRHIMLDEFQDTSALQWENFQTLVTDNMGKGGSTLIVGDVKQSIYRWRGGDCNILATLPTKMSRYNPQSENLDTNYRSTRRIITFNNKLYCNILEHIDNMRSDTEQWSIRPIYSSVKQEVPDDMPDNGCVRINYMTGVSLEEARIAAVTEMCDTIRSLTGRGTHPKDIAILIRNGKELDLVANEFARQLPDVPLVSDDVFSLDQSPAVNIIINALRVILHPDDTASIGRLVYLYNCHVVNHDRETDINRLFDTIERRQTFKSACRWLPAEFSDIEAMRQKPLFEIIMHLHDIFGIDRIEGQSAYMMTFLDYVSSSMRDTGGNLTTLLQMWDESLSSRSIPGGEVNGVNIMTIHRSKGLQWKTVMIPFCNWKIHDDYHHGAIFWSTPEDKRMLCGLPTVAVPMTKTAANSIYSADYTKELQNQRVDNLNLLYVATTRAEDNLFVWGYGKESKSESKPDAKTNKTMIQLIMDTLNHLPKGTVATDDTGTRYQYGDWHPNPKSQAHDRETTRDTTGNRLEMSYTTEPVKSISYPALLTFRQSNEASQWTGMVDEEAPTPQQSTYINRGTVLHNIFATIRTVDDIDAVIAHLPASVTTAMDGRDLSMMAKRLIAKGCQDKRVADWFSAKYDINNECTIVAADPSTGRVREHRPDRVMSDDERVIVVDFKFGTPADSHHAQVTRYKQLLAQMNPNKHIEGYLWYVYKNQIVTV